MLNNCLRLLACAGLVMAMAACDDPPPPRLAAEIATPAAKVTSETIEAEEFRRWALGERLAYAWGRVLAAKKLYQSGDTPSAAEQMSGLAEKMTSADMAALARLGFDAGPLSALSGALDLGRPDEEVSALFETAVANLSEAAAMSGEPAEDIVAFLMRLSAEAYGLGVRFSEIEDLEAYQAAYGYAAAARDLVEPLDPEAYGDLSLELKLLVLMWPSAGPLAGSTPPPEFQMADQFARVKLMLSLMP